ncbi:MAG: alpha/beta hydrolase [Thermoflexales bacterium]|nr:alpha/beta hydrolase [Thermoflexales bacterium]
MTTDSASMNTVTGDDSVDAFCRPNLRDRSPRDLRILESAQPLHFTRRQFLRHGGLGDPEGRGVEGPPIHIAAYAWGDPAWPAVTLAHGWEMQAGRLGRLVEPLLARGFRVIGVDLPAHGASEGELLNVVDAAATLREAAALAGNCVAGIGHSFGGLSTLWLAAHAPPPGWRAVVTLGASSGPAYPLRQTAKAMQWDAARTADFERAFERRFGASIDQFTISRWGERIALPTLLFHDRQDAVIGFDEAEAITAAVPGSRLVETQGLGHISLTRNADIAEQVADFLAAIINPR